MPRGGGSNGGDAQLARKLFDFLQRECGEGNGGGGGRRGREPAVRSARGNRAAGGNSPLRGGDRSASARGAAQGASRDGDWKCPSCSFQPNFGFRQKCWKCGRARGAQLPAGGGKGSVLSEGPIGANGNRPLLGGGAGRQSATACGDKPPSFRVPGASVAAKAAAARASAAASPLAQSSSLGGQGMGAGSGAGTRPPKGETQLCDEDGFQTVRRRGGRPKVSAAADSTARDLESGAEDVDMAGEATPEEAQEDEVDEEEDEEAEAEPEPAALRQRWQQEIVIVKQLARQGIKPDHPAMVAACEARDEAEQRWRGAKPPAPLATRLGWAQQKLDRAIGIQAETHQKLVALEEEFKAKRAVLQAQMGEDAERVRKRRSQLQAVQEEAGGPATQRQRGGGGEAVRKACNAIRHEVAPALAVLAEQLGSGSEAWATVNGLLSTLASSQQAMEEAMADAAPTFNIADEDESVWSESHDLREPPLDQGARAADADNGDWHAQQQRQCAPPAWQQNQQQHLQERQWTDQRGLHNDGDGGDAQQWHQWHQTGWTGAPKWRESGHGNWTRTSWADAWESEQCADADMDEQPEPRCKHRRQGDATFDKEEAAAGASSGPGAAGQPGQAPSQQQEGEGDRHHAELLANVVAAALQAGIQPLTMAGEDLQVLSAHQLAAWAAENIPTS